MKEEAQLIIDKAVKPYRSNSYSVLQSMLAEGGVTDEKRGASGIEYQVDVRFRYDDKKAGTIRVHGSIYRIKAAAPWWQFWKNVDSPVAYSDFIVRPDGTFVDED